MTFSSGPGMITARDNKESGRAPSVLCELDFKRQVDAPFMKLFDEELLVELKLPRPPSANSIWRANRLGASISLKNIRRGLPKATA